MVPCPFLRAVSGMRSASAGPPVSALRAHRGHGAHGKGVQAREEHDDAPAPTPPEAKGSDRGGDSGWDGGRAGGSVIDKR